MRPMQPPWPEGGVKADSKHLCILEGSRKGPFLGYFLTRIFNKDYGILFPCRGPRMLGNCHIGVSRIWGFVCLV